MPQQQQQQPQPQQQPQQSTTAAPADVGMLLSLEAALRAVAAADGGAAQAHALAAAAALLAGLAAACSSQQQTTQTFFSVAGSAGTPFMLTRQDRVVADDRLGGAARTAGRVPAYSADGAAHSSLQTTPPAAFWEQEGEARLSFSDPGTQQQRQQQQRQQAWGIAGCDPGLPWTPLGSR